MPAPSSAPDPRSSSTAARNPDHHLWCNNGTYFVHLTVLWRARTKVRLRKSLKTRDVVAARVRRDRLLAHLAQREDITLLTR